MTILFLSLSINGMKRESDKSLKKRERIAKAAKVVDSKNVSNRGIETSDSSFFDAAEKGHKEIIALLIEKGADVNAKDSNGSTALIMAAEKGHKEVIALLIEQGADVNVRGKYGWPALFVAARKDHKEVIALLIEKGADINVRDDDGWTALLLAAANNCSEAVAFLIEQGADVNACVTNYKLNALMYFLHNKKIMTLLIEKGTDINAQDNKGNTALIQAVQAGHRQAVAFLVSKGADVDVKNNRGHTALMEVENRGKSQLEAFFLANATGDFHANLKKHQHEIPLIVAENKKLKQLLELCSEPEIQGYLQNSIAYVTKNKFITIGKGQTLLMLACIFDQADVISLFYRCSLEYLNSCDCYGNSAFYYAIEYKSFDCAAMLINYYGTKISELHEHSIIGFIRSYFSSFTPNKKKVEELLDLAIDAGSLNLVNSLLGIGAHSTIELAQKAQENGYLKIMHRLLFTTLVSLPEQQRYPQITNLSGLFK